ncbi:MAG: aromatic ring-hydroxylating dioxygenase subunit alpha [Novosphingobium sp.]|nr:aromatic ring-hydroxylating dioxygenase subunit alpha [Novosphingobium sp.]MCP5402826.1 aromatic ring-hydroxylating dioxygenase subunit alpha [Novosphingobium sp.]
MEAQEVAARKRELKLPKLEMGDGVLHDQEKYYSPEIMEREWETLWTRVWIIAGRVSDLRKVGDWFRFEFGRESLIIVRSAEDRIQAFYNVCQHRGSQIVDRDFGHGNAFVCPFHSWAWNIDGSLKRITDAETFPEKTICDNPGLTEVRCETWGGFVFVNMDENAAPLREFLGGLADALDVYRMEEMIVAKDYSVDWPMNWKISLDAFMEGYHAHARHPELVRMIDDFNFEYDIFGNGHSKMVIPMWTKSPRIAERTGLTEELRFSIESAGLDPKNFEDRQADVRPAVIEARRKWAERFGIDISDMTDTQVADDGNYNAFPNITFNAHPEGVLVMRFLPHATDPARCRYDVWVLSVRSSDPEFALPFYMAVPPETDLSGKGERPARQYVEHGDEGLGVVLNQDGDSLPMVQAGVQSRGFKGIRLSNQEIRLRYFYEEYARYLGGVK